MSDKKRVFIAFAIEDKTSRDFLVGQSKNAKCPFEFMDMSVKEPWDDDWKKRCRTKIKGCDGVIALLSKNSTSATGQKWEVKCSKEEGKKVLGVYKTQNDRPATLPDEFDGIRKVGWTWETIKTFIDSL